MSTAPNNFSAVYSSSTNPATAQWAQWAHMLAHATSANMQPHQQRNCNHQYQQNNQHQQVVPTTQSQPPWFSSEQLHGSSWIPPPLQQSSHIQSIQSLAVHSSAQFHHQSANSFRYRLNNRAVASSAISKTNFPEAPAVATQEKEKEPNDDVWGYLEAQAAFLGPSLWENSDLKVECLDLEEFLTENGIPLNDGNKGRSSTKEDVAHNKSADAPSTGRNIANQKSDDSQPGPSNSPAQSENEKEVPSNDDDSSSSSSGSSAYQSITPALVSPKATNRRKRTAVSIASSFNDNISDDGSYVPGLDFDPKNRSFSQEELRPQPMSKKSKKQYVPEDLKDDKYWARRNKNNMAAKRSRDARRSKENQIAMRAAFLEKEVVAQNAVLKAELDKVTKLYAAALKRLEQYEKPGKK